MFGHWPAACNVKPATAAYGYGHGARSVGMVLGTIQSPPNQQRTSYATSYTFSNLQPQHLQSKPASRDLLEPTDLSSTSVRRPIYHRLAQPETFKVAANCKPIPVLP